METIEMRTVEHKPDFILSRDLRPGDIIEADMYAMAVRDRDGKLPLERFTPSGVIGIYRGKSKSAIILVQSDARGLGKESPYGFQNSFEAGTHFIERIHHKSLNEKDLTPPISIAQDWANPYHGRSKSKKEKPLKRIGFVERVPKDYQDSLTALLEDDSVTLSPEQIEQIKKELRLFKFPGYT